MLDCSLNDTKELRKLILENPDLPLLIFCKDSEHDYFPKYEKAEINEIEIMELTLYKDCWLNKGDYRDEIEDDLDEDEEYADLSYEEYEKMIDKKVEETEFIKAIVILVGH